MKDGEIVMQMSEEKGTALLGAAYRHLKVSYPKFFKMDALSKAGLIASELLLADERERFVPREDRAVVLFSRHGCEADDIHYRETITDGNYFPSPALFVYTLPNVVTGEIAIRNLYRGETSAYVLEKFDAGQIVSIVSESFEDPETDSVLCGWVDCADDNNVEALVFLVENGDGEEFTADVINRILTNYK